MELIKDLHECNCRYFPSLFSDFVGAFSGGCIIDESEPAPKGFKCHCSMPFFFTCHGTPIACTANEEEECLGGPGEDSCDPSGNCAGYVKKKQLLESSDMELFERDDEFEPLA